MSRKPCVLVCATSQSSSEKLIEAGRTIAQREGLDLRVLNVQPSCSEQALDSEMVENLHQRCKSIGAEMTVYFNDYPDLVAASHARKYNAVNIITGFPGEKSSGFIARIHMLVPDVTISMVDNENDTVYNLTPRTKDMGVLLNNI